MTGLNALERYLADCESKRRRMRDRPSDAVLVELRRLLQQLEDAQAGRAPMRDAEAAPPN